MRQFTDRREAGKQLARKLSKYESRSDVIILALPRGGVPVAYEIALALKAPLDVLIVRKLGLPGREELAVGAIASGGIQTLNQDILDMLGIAKATIDIVVERELAELQRRKKQYRSDRPAPEVRDRSVIIVDDGLATGATMRAAVMAVRAQNAQRIVVAVPAAASEAIELLQSEVDEIAYVIAPYMFEGVGKWYDDFSQTSDEEVKFLLDAANQQLQNN